MQELAVHNKVLYLVKSFYSSLLVWYYSLYLSSILYILHYKHVRNRPHKCRYSFRNDGSTMSRDHLSGKFTCNIGRAAKSVRRKIMTMHRICLGLNCVHNITSGKVRGFALLLPYCNLPLKIHIFNSIEIYSVHMHDCLQFLNCTVIFKD